MSTRVLVQSCRHELVERGSRFLGLAFPCQSIDEFKDRKAEIEASYPDATHITYAFKIYSKGQVIIRFSDAGEPAGTAGKPMLMHIEGQKLVNTAVFVVRYYGGTKLGAGGLARAYGQTCRQVLLAAETAPYQILVHLSLRFPYSQQTQVEYLARSAGAELSQWRFTDKVEVTTTLAAVQKESFLEQLAPEVILLTNDS